MKYRFYQFLLVVAGFVIVVGFRSVESDLMTAASTGHTETVKALLAAGADVNATSEKGGTALMGAAMEGHTEIVQLLKEAGAQD